MSTRGGFFSPRLDAVKRFVSAITVASFLAGCAASQPPPSEMRSADAERARLLYENACGQCHTTQPHWRDRKIVESWPDLVMQVTRWQSIAGQNWTIGEIDEVAAYLNRRFYKQPCPVAGCAD